MTQLVHRARDLAPAAAVVMTMGALHEGHAALIRAARAKAGDGVVTVTVFVNPLQFGPNEDLDRYPRTLDADLELAAAAGADLVFAPPADEVYPGGAPQVRITAGPMGERYEGAARPGHFDGVLTVVAKLLHLTRPGAAFFGQKDAQQLALIRRMATDLNFPVEIAAVPTVRESDGLALSSRNRYLSAAERQRALALSRALFAGRDHLADGPDAVRKAARASLAEADGLAVDYLDLIDPATFTQAGPAHTGPAVLAVAAKVGSTRLIDNIPLEFPAAPGSAADAAAVRTVAADTTAVHTTAVHTAAVHTTAAHAPGVDAAADVAAGQGTAAPGTAAHREFGAAQ